MDNQQMPDYGPNGWYGTPAQAATMPQPDGGMARFRQYTAAGVLAIAMIAGGSAVVMAASPDPSASPSPGATSGQDGSSGSSGSGGTTDDGTSNPRGNHPCPKDGSGSDQSTDSSVDATSL